MVSSREVRAGATLLSANANLIRPIGQDSWRMEVESTSLPRSPDPSLCCLTQTYPSLIHPCAVLPKPIQTYPTYPSPGVHSVFFEPVYLISCNLIHFYTVHPLFSHLIQSNLMQFKTICSIPSILVQIYQTLSTQSNVSYN